MNPKVSIITINYNHAQALRTTINSVVQQTYSNKEYLIIDGGSADESVSVIKEFESHISYWISEKDTGIYHAMNKGIAASTGDYILFLNSGDVLNGKSALEDFITHPDFYGDIIYGDYKFSNGEKIYPDKVTPYYFVKSSLPHQSTLFKSDVFVKMGYFDESYKICGDRDFYLKCLLRDIFEWKHIKYPLAIFDLEGLSNNLNYQQQKKQEDHRLWRENFGVFYDDYMYIVQLNKQLSMVKKQTLKGIVKRIKSKIKHLCKVR